MDDSYDGFGGTGPGPRTLDGCSVDLYRRFSYGGDLDLACQRLPAGASVLELGCGAGQGTRVLVERGFAVTAVDNSPDMLALGPATATRVLGDIETLDLGHQVDAVLLPTCLIHHAVASVRDNFVACARRHLAVGGWFFLQRQREHLFDHATPGHVAQSGSVKIDIEAVSALDGVTSMTVRYSDQGDTWRHSFRIVPLKEDDLQALLSRGGFGPLSWLDEDRTWLCAQAV